MMTTIEAGLRHDIDFFRHLSDRPDPWPTADEVREAMQKGWRNKLAMWLAWLPSPDLSNPNQKAVALLLHDWAHGKK